MLVRQLVLHVDHAHHAIARDDRRRKKRFVRVFPQTGKVLKPGIVVGLARNRQLPPFARHPSG